MNIKEEIIKTGEKLKQEFKEAERFDLREEDKKFVDLVFESFSNPPEKLIELFSDHPGVLSKITLTWLVWAWNKLDRGVSLDELIIVIEDYYIHNRLG